VKLGLKVPLVLLDLLERKAPKVPKAPPVWTLRWAT
jgi:hypothetical protein